MVNNEKMRVFNEMVKQMNHDGFTIVSNWRTAEEGMAYIHPAENFDPQTMTWKQGSRAVGELRWNGVAWAVTWY